MQSLFSTFYLFLLLVGKLVPHTHLNAMFVMG